MEGSGEGTKSKDSSPAAPPTLKKGPWTAEEDAILIEHVRKNGEGNWNFVQRSTGLARCGKSCRLRWANHLRPDLKKGQLTMEEEELVLRLHAQLGNKWARMAAQLPGRTDNEIKNYWNTRVKRRQRVGMPLYPPTVLQCPRPPPVFNSTMTFSPLSTSAMQQLAEVPRGAKRAREDVDGMMMTMFRFPVSPGPSVVPRIWHTAPSTPTGRTMFDYGIMPPPMTAPMPPSTAYSSHVLDGGREVELMDKLLREEERRTGNSDSGSGNHKKKSPDHHALNCEGGEEAFVGLEELEYYRSSTPFPTNYYSHESDHLWIGDDMIPTQQHAAVTTPPDWNNSDGGQSVLTNDDLTVDQHQLASPSSPTTPDWNIASCHWNSMPELV